MKQLYIALALVVGIGATAAYAYSCTTTCYQLGNQVICNEYCY